MPAITPIGDIGHRLSSLFGDQQIRRIEIVFDAREVIHAKLDVIVSAEQAASILDICESQRWEMVEDEGSTDTRQPTQNGQQSE